MSALRVFPFSTQLSRPSTRKIRTMFEGIDSAREHPHLKKDLPWGFVIYRCSYGDNRAWERMLGAIDKSVKESLEDEDNNRPDLLSSYEPVIFDDKEKFDGATSHEVRDHFSVWVAEQLPQIVASPGILPRLQNPLTKLGPEAGLGQRWNFCLFVDDICLESLDHMFFPVVKLLYKQWGRLEPHERTYEVHPSWEDGVTDIDEEDVGWMYMDICSYVDEYARLEPYWAWYDEYLRPPSMMDLDQSEYPGFWRKDKSEKREAEDSESE